MGQSAELKEKWSYYYFVMPFILIEAPAYVASFDLNVFLLKDYVSIKDNEFFD